MCVMVDLLLDVVWLLMLLAVVLGVGVWVGSWGVGSPAGNSCMWGCEVGVV